MSDPRGPDEAGATRDLADSSDSTSLVGTREELRVRLEEAGLGPNQTRVWLDSPTALLSGLIPADAIRDPATAGRARRATRRLIDSLGPRVPDRVALTAARVLDPSNRTVLLEFDDGARHALDLGPFLWGPGFDEVRAFHEVFDAMYVEEGHGLRWPTGAVLSAELLYGVSRPVDGTESSPRDG